MEPNRSDGPRSGRLRAGRVAATAVGAMIAALVLSGCGTVVVQNIFTVRIEDPANRLSAGPTAVSIFDSQMGASDEWARKTMGTTSASSPYTTVFSSTTTKMIGDGSPASTVTAGLAIPAYAAKGYFALNLTPVDGQTTRVEAPFVGYYDYNVAVDGQRRPLAVVVTSTAQGSDWKLDLVVHIP